MLEFENGLTPKTGTDNFFSKNHKLSQREKHFIYNLQQVIIKSKLKLCLRIIHFLIIKKKIKTRTDR